MSLIDSQQLLEVIRTTKADIKLFAASGLEDRVTPDIAFRLALTGRYVGGGSRHRVRYLREVVDERNAADPKRWRDRSCRHYDTPVSRTTVDLWDRVLQGL